MQRIFLEGLGKLALEVPEIRGSFGGFWQGVGHRTVTRIPAQELGPMSAVPPPEDQVGAVADRLGILCAPVS